MLLPPHLVVLLFTRQRKCKPSSYSISVASSHSKPNHPAQRDEHHRSPAVGHLANHLANPDHSHLASPLNSHRLSPTVSHLANHLVNPVHSHLASPLYSRIHIHLVSPRANPHHNHRLSPAVSHLANHIINPVHSHLASPLHLFPVVFTAI